MIRIRLTALVMALLAVLLGAHDSHAEDGSIALHVEGTKATTHRERILEAIPDGVEIIDAGAWKQAMRRTGVPGRLGQAITSRSMRRELLKVTRRAIKNADVDAVIMARAYRGRGGMKLHFLMIGREGGPLVDEAVELSSKMTEKEEIQAIRNVLSAALEPFAPPPPPEPEPEPEPEPVPTGEGDDDDDDDDDDEPFEANRPGSELFNLFLGVEFVGRFFDYSESPANTSNTRPYNVFGAPSIHISGEVYPAAMLDLPIVPDIGIVGMYLHTFGLQSQTERVLETDPQFFFDNSWNAYRVGLRYRHRFGDDDPIVLMATGQFGSMRFEFEALNPDSAAIINEVPNVEYQYLRGAIDARIPVWRFAFMLGAGYIGPLSAGEVYDRFTGSSVGGIDARLDIAFILAQGFETRVGVNYQRYFYSFAPEVGDAYVAGGALDQLLGVRLGAAYVY